MPASPSQRALTPAPAVLFGGQQGVPVLICNPDTANTVYIGYGPGISVGAANTIPLGPGQSVTVDGSESVYGCAPSGTAATVIIPGGSSFFQPTTLSDLGGVKVYVQAAAPSGSIPVNSIWIDTANGSISNWNGSSWVQQTFDAANLIQAGTIIASLIEAGTITASLLAAGIVVAGIIDGTTVSAATFEGSVFEGTDFIVNDDGAFFYSATPAADNLVLSVTQTAGQDGQGNWYLPGCTAYGYNATAGVYTAVQLGVTASAAQYGLAWYTASEMTGASSPWTAGPEIYWDADDGYFNVTTASEMILTASQFLFQGPVAISGTVAAPTTIATDTWHNVTPAGSWSLQSGQPMQYILQPDGDVEISGALDCSSGYAEGTLTLFTLPSDYRPNRSCYVPVAVYPYSAANSEMAWYATISTAGVVSVNFPAASTITAVIIGARFPLASNT